MKTIQSIIIGIISILNILSIGFSQENYEKGVKSYLAGEYDLAESFFSLYLDEFPYSSKGLYNLAVTKLMLQDTLGFCEYSYFLKTSYYLDYFESPYFSLCMRKEIIYYNKNFEVTTSRLKSRYYEVLNHHFRINKTIGEIFQGKRERTSLYFTYDGQSAYAGYYSNMLAQYRVSDNNIKVYSLSDTPAEFPGGMEAFDDFLYDNPYYLQASKNKCIKGTSALIGIVINEEGKIINLNIINSNADYSCTDELTRLLGQMLRTSPDFIPGKHMNTKINYELFIELEFKETMF